MVSFEGRKSKKNQGNKIKEINDSENITTAAAHHHLPPFAGTSYLPCDPLRNFLLFSLTQGNITKEKRSVQLFSKLAWSAVQPPLHLSIHHLSTSPSPPHTITSPFNPPQKNQYHQSPQSGHHRHTRWGAS